MDISCIRTLKVRCVLHTCQYLDNGCENESLSLFDPEELKDEDEEADATQYSGKDHGSLDCLQIS